MDFRFLINLFFPPCCIVCDEPLASGEQHICIRCLMNMPLMPYQPNRENDIEKRFLGKVPFQRATSYFRYTKGSPYDRILFALKYHGRKEIGYSMGRQAAQSLSATGFFDGIDLIIPIPLHPKRYRQRGYNQSEWIARGISELTGLPIDTTSVVRNAYNSTQTHKNKWNRWDDSQHIFSLITPESIQGKHILLVDDVLTTGATLTSCAEEILKAENAKISFFTLAGV